jgi:hypothetical protein
MAQRPVADSILGMSVGAQLWPIDYRSAIWRASSYCLPVARRRVLLDESQEVAAAKAHECEDVVDRYRGCIGRASADVQAQKACIP